MNHMRQQSDSSHFMSFMFLLSKTLPRHPVNPVKKTD
jgi:hypothetical protein